MITITITNRVIYYSNPIGNLIDYTTLQETYKDIYDKRLKEQQNYKSYYDLKHKEIEFQIGDQVLILFDVPTKGPLMPRWEGPYKIIEKVNPVTYKVENDEKLITIHVQRMKLVRNLRSNAHI